MVERAMLERPREAALAFAALVGLALVPLIAERVGDPSITTLVSRMLIYAIAAVSLDLILGYGGMASFGHAAYFGLGGYVVGILAFHLRSREPFLGLIPGTDELLFTLPAAIAVSGLAALALGALSLRTSGIHFIMITLAFAQMLFFLFVSAAKYGADDGLSIRRRNSLPGLDLRDDTQFYWLVLVLAVLFLLLCRQIVGSRFGLVLGAVRQSERRLAAVGVSTYRYKLAAFVIAGMGAGLAGALWANQARFVSPDMLHWTKSGELMIMVILGGAGTLFGPFAGAFLLIGLETVLSRFTENWQFYLGPILVLIVLFVRRGVISLVWRRG